MPDPETHMPRSESAVEREQSRWQDRIDELVYKVYPQRDGTGECDSSDPLDLTCVEISQAFNHLQNKIADLRAAMPEPEKLRGIAARQGRYGSADIDQLRSWAEQIEKVMK